MHSAWIKERRQLTCWIKSKSIDKALANLRKMHNKKNFLPMTLQLLIFNISNILNMGFFNVVIILLLRKVHNIYINTVARIYYSQIALSMQKHCLWFKSTVLNAQQIHDDANRVKSYAQLYYRNANWSQATKPVIAMHDELLFNAIWKRLGKRNLPWEG